MFLYFYFKKIWYFNWMTMYKYAFFAFLHSFSLSFTSWSLFASAPHWPARFKCAAALIGQHWNIDRWDVMFDLQTLNWLRAWTINSVAVPATKAAGHYWVGAFFVSCIDFVAVFLLFTMSTKGPKQRFIKCALEAISLRKQVISWELLDRYQEMCFFFLYRCYL